MILNLKQSTSDINLVVKRAATGLGLFTLQPIKSGSRIIEYVGELISNEESNKRGGKYLFQLSQRRVIDGKDRSNTARYINHSCRPNAKGYSERSKIFIYAERDIHAGEQITIDYGTEYFRQHIAAKGCKCEHCTKLKANRSHAVDKKKRSTA